MENKMGKGGDFDFAIYNADTEEGAFSRLAFGSSLGARRWSRHAARRQLCACDQPTPLASWTSSIFKLLTWTHLDRVHARPRDRAALDVRPRTTLAAGASRARERPVVHGHGWWHRGRRSRRTARRWPLERWRRRRQLGLASWLDEQALRWQGRPARRWWGWSRSECPGSSCPR